jgi:transposase
MMSTTAKHPDITPIPVQLSEPEFNAFIFPHLSMPKRGPRCKLGYHRLFNRILWVLYTGMQWKCLPIPKGPTGKPEIHDTNVYRAFAKWVDDGSLQQAFIASVAHLSDERKLDVRVLHGDGTNTVAKKGGMALGIRGTNTRRARKSSRSRTTMAMCWLPSLWRPSMRRTWCCCRRVYKP